MENNRNLNFDPGRVESPAYVVDLERLEANARILRETADQGGARLLMALKAFSMFSSFPRIKPYINGICASSPDEARLGREELDLEVHGYAAAYSEAQLKEYLTLSDHMVFNSLSQWNRFKPLIKNSPRKISCGIRLNPRQREAETPLYDPSAPFSRLGIPSDALDFNDPEQLEGIEGIHVHNLCEQNFDALERTWAAVERQFAPILSRMKWINLGGGHHITRPDYNRSGLIDFLKRLNRRYGAQLYMEPGEAFALNCGYLVTRVLDITENRKSLALLDTSAPCHMPDVLEMPYRPEIIGAGREGEKAHSYRLGGLSCLAGDVIGDYSFDSPLEIGTPLVFTDMAHYTMVKNNTFNGIRLPSIYTTDSREGLKLIKSFGYEDFKGRLS